MPRLFLKTLTVYNYIDNASVVQGVLFIESTTLLPADHISIPMSEHVMGIHAHNTRTLSFCNTNNQ